MNAAEREEAQLATGLLHHDVSAYARCRAYQKRLRRWEVPRWLSSPVRLHGLFHPRESNSNLLRVFVRGKSVQHVIIGLIVPVGGRTMPFSNFRDNFDSETLAILEIAFNEAWEVLIASGGNFDQKATRDALAELIVSFAFEGESDPKRLKELALADPPRTLETACR